MIQKEKAINWINTYFIQEEESLYRDLEVEVKNKNIDSIVSLSEKLHDIKERKAEVLEHVEDAEDFVELIQVLLDWEDADRELELDYISYIFDVRSF
jgi:hypothetical protein